MTAEFDFNAARMFLLNKRKKRIRRNRGLYKKASNDCSKIIKMIIEKYNPKRIYQWGSLLHPEQFSEISDIDIAVEGISSAETFFKLFGDADTMTKIALDLVELEKVEPVHRDSIIRKGKLVYERKE
jgi:predicted nucleotidyltransferase